MSIVNIQDVSKFYGEHRLLNEINLQIEKGEFIAVVGPSGSGKSTLLRMVAGLDSVTKGSILINNQCVNKMPAASRDLAMVFQHYALYPHMTTYDNMAYGLKLRGMKKAEIAERVRVVASILQLNDYLTRKPSMLSGGQCQRVAMGRAIIREPAVCLFDEPLSNLDAKLRTELRHEIKKLHRQLNMTCLYVTHDQTEAMILADRVVVLNKGCVEQIGTARELYENPSTLFVASFIGLYPMNFLQATLDVKNKLVVTPHGIELPLYLSDLTESDQPVIIAIRPEHLNLTTQGSIPVSIEFIDDMGSDKLVQVITETGETRLLIRVPGDALINETRMFLELDLTKAHVFCKKTGLRLGD